MGCSCRDKGKKWTVKLAGGLTLTGKTEAEALKLAAKHVGSKVIAPVK